MLVTFDLDESCPSVSTAQRNERRVLPSYFYSEHESEERSVASWFGRLSLCLASLGGSRRLLGIAGRVQQLVSAKVSTLG